MHFADFVMTFGHCYNETNVFKMSSLGFLTPAHDHWKQPCWDKPQLPAHSPAYSSSWLRLPHRSPFIDIAMPCSTSQETRRKGDLSRPLVSSVYQRKCWRGSWPFPRLQHPPLCPLFSVSSLCSHFLPVCPLFPLTSTSLSSHFFSQAPSLLLF